MIYGCGSECEASTGSHPRTDPSTAEAARAANSEDGLQFSVASPLALKVRRVYDLDRRASSSPGHEGLVRSRPEGLCCGVKSELRKNRWLLQADTRHVKMLLFLQLSTRESRSLKCETLSLTLSFARVMVEGCGHP